MTDSEKSTVEGKMKRTRKTGVKKDVKLNLVKQLGKKQRTFCIILGQQVKFSSEFKFFLKNVDVAKASFKRRNLVWGFRPETYWASYEQIEGNLIGLLKDWGTHNCGKSWRRLVIRSERLIKVGDSLVFREIYLGKV